MKNLFMLPRQPNYSIIDGIRCLQAIVSQERPVGISEVAADLGLEVTRVHRLLRTLAHMGLIRQTAKRKYAPGPGLPVLAAQTLHAIHFSGKPLQVLENLRKQSDLTVALGVRWQRTVSYLYHAAPGEFLTESIGTYRAWPAERSGIGVILLSHLKDEDVLRMYEKHPLDGPDSLEGLLQMIRTARRQGYAHVGLGTLAVALASNENMSVAFTGDIPVSRVNSLLPQLRAAARDLDAAFESAAPPLD